MKQASARVVLHLLNTQYKVIWKVHSTVVRTTSMKELMRLKFKFLWIGFISFAFFSCGSIEKDFENVASINTIEAYQKFIKDHRCSDDSYYCDEARRGIEKILMSEVNTKGDLEIFAEYLKDNPVEFHPINGWTIFDELLWKQVIEEDTKAAYEKYLKYFPDRGDFTEEAKGKLAEIRFWEKTLEENTINAFEEYISGPFNNDNHEREAFKRLGNLLWERIVKDGNVEIYEKYIEKYRLYSNFDRESEERKLEEYVWMQTLRSGSTKAFGEFLEKYSNSVHSSEAILKFLNLPKPKQGYGHAYGQISSTKKRPKIGGIYVYLMKIDPERSNHVDFSAITDKNGRWVVRNIKADDRYIAFASYNRLSFYNYILFSQKDIKYIEAGTATFIPVNTFTN